MVNNDFLQKINNSDTLILVGLGNVGDRYNNTRHNVGFMFIDELAKKLGVQLDEKKDLDAFIGKTVNENQTIWLIKPTTFMNLSGKAIQKFLNYYKLATDNLIVVHDDLDINLGEVKISYKKGPRVHNGVNSIEQNLSTDEFWRVRIGVENRDQELRTKIKGENYVLMQLTEPELSLIQNSTVDIINSF